MASLMLTAAASEAESQFLEKGDRSAIRWNNLSSLKAKSCPLLCIRIQFLSTKFPSFLLELDWHKIEARQFSPSLNAACGG